MSQPTNNELWAETVRTARLIRGYRSSLEEVEEEILTGSGKSPSHELLVELASDAEILASFIEQLDERGVSFA